MSPEDLRPILSGLAGAAVAGWLTAKLDCWVPTSVNEKSRADLLGEYNTCIRAANVVSVASLLAALAAYKFLGIATNDFRPFGLAIGFALGSPLLVVPVWSWLTDRPVAEALAGYSMSQRLPVAMTCAIEILGWALFAFCAMKAF